MFIERTEVEAETLILWPPDAKSWLIWKDPNAGKDWRRDEKGMTEDEMAGWHHRLNGHGFGWTLGVGDGWGGLACCGPWGHKELDTTERLNWIEPEATVLFLAGLGLLAAQGSLVAESRGSSLVVVHRLLLLQACALRCMGSITSATWSW